MKERNESWLVSLMFRFEEPKKEKKAKDVVVWIRSDAASSALLFYYPPFYHNTLLFHWYPHTLSFLSLAFFCVFILRILQRRKNPFRSFHFFFCTLSLSLSLCVS
jgi:membrane-associated HD superfamily phosphohydrolase